MEDMLFRILRNFSENFRYVRIILKPHFLLYPNWGGVAVDRIKSVSVIKNSEYC